MDFQVSGEANRAVERACARAAGETARAGTGERNRADMSRSGFC